MKSILVTGVAGFLGRYVARHFFDQGWQVIGIDSVASENSPLAYLSTYFAIKLPSLELDKILADHKPACCIHCAGRASVPQSVIDPLPDFESGPELVFSILDSLRRTAPECKFVLLSSAAVYGNPPQLPVSEDDPPAPVSPYGYHKWQSEILVQEFAKVYQLATASVRIFSAYGPGLRRQVIWDICRKALVQQEIILQGTGKESRDFLYASDIATALELVAVQAPMQGEVYNLASGQQVTIAELAHKLLDILGLQCELSFDGQVPTGTPLNWQADISRLVGLGFSPKVSLDQGLGIVARWCRAEISPDQVI